MLVRNKSMEDLKSTDYSNNSSPSLSVDLKNYEARREPSLGSQTSLSRGPSPAQQLQHSMLEKCLRLYELFYVKLVERRILDRDKSVNELFDNLKVSSSKESFEERTKHLEQLLSSKLDSDDSDSYSQELSSPEDKQLGMTKNKTFYEIIFICFRERLDLETTCKYSWIQIPVEFKNFISKLHLFNFSEWL